MGEYKQEAPKRRIGDRRDGTLIRNIDSMHYITPYLYPNRADNEAYISEHIDLTNITKFLELKNQGNEDFPYTLFHIVVTAVLKTIYQRPKMNRFIQGKRIYQRNELTAAFVVKKGFNDDAHEALAFVRCNDDFTIDTMHSQLYDEITSCRSDKPDNSTDGMDMLMRLPRFLCSLLMTIFRRLDYHGIMPESLVKTDPYYATVFLSNLGSIKLRCGYHHLTNWGTNSIFVIIGEKRMTPFFSEDGAVTFRETVDLGLTVDERIADGYYYSKTIKLLKHLLENPQLLEEPANLEVDF